MVMQEGAGWTHLDAGVVGALSASCTGHFEVVSGTMGIFVKTALLPGFE